MNKPDQAYRRFALKFPGKEVALTPGEYLIGRDSECDIPVDDELVSRKHARVVVSDADVTICDLGSANGVFVNECRIRQPMALEASDRVVIGTTEIVVVPDPLFIGTRVISDVMPATRGDRPSTEGPSSTLRPRTATEGTEATEATTAEKTKRADTFELFGRLADRMLQRGDAHAAARLLTGHVTGVIEGVRAAPIEDELIDVASRYCLKMAAATADGSWVDRAFELHIAAARPMAADTIVQLSLVLRSAPRVDRSLFETYCALLRSKQDAWGTDDRALAEQVLRLALP